MIGVGKSHYATPKDGPFKCANCEYFKNPTFCGNRVVVDDAARGTLAMKGGLAIIQPEGCCNEYEPK